MLVSGIGSAQSFDFSCDLPDANGVRTHDGFETYDTGNTLYGSDRYPNYIIRLVTFNGNVFFRTERINPRQSRRNFGEGTFQQRYDNAVADIMSVAPFIPRINVAEGVRDLVGSVSFLTSNGVIHDLQHGDEIPEGATEFIAYDVDGSYGGDGTLLRGPVTPEEDLDICFSIFNVTPGLVTVSDPTFVTGIAIGDARYPRGSVIPGEFSEFRIIAGNNRTIGPFRNTVECGVLTVDTSLDLGGVRPFQLDPVSVFALDGDPTGLYYNFAGKNWIIARNGATYIFTSGNQTITTISLGFSGRRFTFGQYSYLFEGEDGSPKVGITTNRDNTIELEGSVRLQDFGILKFFPIGDNGTWAPREQSIFAIVHKGSSTDAANLNNEVIDLTPIGHVQNISSLDAATFEPNAVYAYRNGSDGRIRLVKANAEGTGAEAYVIPYFSFPSSERYLWRINDPNNLDDGRTRYVYVNNQRRNSNLTLHDQESGYFSVNTGIYGGYDIDIGDNEGRFRTDVSTGRFDVVNYYVDADDQGLSQPGLRPGDYAVMRNNHATGNYDDARSGARGYAIIRMIARRNGTIRYVPVYSFDTFNPGWRFGGSNDIYVVPYAATYLASAQFK